MSKGKDSKKQNKKKPLKTLMEKRGNYSGRFLTGFAG